MFPKFLKYKFDRNRWNKGRMKDRSIPSVSLPFGSFPVSFLDELLGVFLLADVKFFGGIAAVVKVSLDSC